MASINHLTRADAIELIRNKALSYSKEGFNVVSGRSHWYCDVKQGLSHGRDLFAVGDLAVRTVRNELGITYNTVGGPTMGADCITHAIITAASEVDDPFACQWFSVRKDIDEERPPDGTSPVLPPRFPPSTPEKMLWLEGCRPDADSKVLWIEDAISTGASIEKAMQDFKQHPTARDARIVGALAVVDRGDAATELFARMGIPYVALVTYKDLGIPHIGQG